MNIEIPGFEIVATSDLLAAYRLLRDVAQETIAKAGKGDPIGAEVEIGLAWLEGEIARMEAKIAMSPGTSARRSSTEAESP